MLLMLTPGVIKLVRWLVARQALASVILLTGFHGAMSKWRRDFLEDRNTRPQRFYRIANEVPTLLVVIIVNHGDRPALLDPAGGPSLRRSEPRARLLHGAPGSAARTGRGLSATRVNPSSRIGGFFRTALVADQRVSRKGLHYRGCLDIALMTILLGSRGAVRVRALAARS